ncbi:hypothetical protein D3C72_2301260 [compost metagenome]
MLHRFFRQPQYRQIRITVCKLNLRFRHAVFIPHIRIEEDLILKSRFYVADSDDMHLHLLLERNLLVLIEPVIHGTFDLNLIRTFA